MFRKGLSICLFVLAMVLMCCTVYVCDKAVNKEAAGKLYSTTNDIPHNKVGILLGVSKYVGDSMPDPYYDYRINAAVQLWKAKKIDYIIASGEYRNQDYNEPAQMREDLENAGVDPSCIFLDHAGFRTFDSMVRLKEIFGQTSATVISQKFHNERALFIAYKEGIRAIGFNAKDVSDVHTSLIREKLARVKVFVDYLLGKEPRYLGEKEYIP